MAAGVRSAAVAGVHLERFADEVREAVTAAIADLRAAGIAAGAQVALADLEGGELAIAHGLASDGAQLTGRHRLPVFCLTKTVTALAVLTLCHDEGIALDDAVARVLPEFARSGKGQITLRQLLTNTAGLDESGLAGCRDGATARDRYLRACWAPVRPGWRSGRDARYDYESAFTTLGFWVERVAAAPYAGLLAGRFGHVLGDLAFLADLEGRELPREDDDPPWTPHLFMPAGLPWLASEQSARSGSPAGGAVSCAADVCRLWAAIARAAAGRDDGVIAPEVARTMVTPCRGRRYDQQLARVCDYGLGVMTGLADYHSWGLPGELTSASYGHLGLGVSFAGFLPDLGVAFALLLNGASRKQVEFQGQRMLFTAFHRVLARGEAGAR